MTANRENALFVNARIVRHEIDYRENTLFVNARIVRHEIDYCVTDCGPVGGASKCRQQLKSLGKDATRIPST
ncbi:MAG: hypothetical protein HQ582_32200 [Planctomycetes bacterium]|nr:hypothetical protein [Planctomycetota bacterium]